jgi:hypothetical protein
MPCMRGQGGQGGQSGTFLIDTRRRAASRFGQRVSDGFDRSHGRRLHHVQPAHAPVICFHAVARATSSQRDITGT